MRDLACRMILMSALLAASGNAAFAQSSDDIHSGLTSCAAIAKNSDRLNCYDLLAQRGSSVTSTANVAAPTAVAVTPGSSPAPPVPNAAAQAQDFGLTEVQKPKTEKLQAIDASIASIRLSPNGRTRVALDNGQSWELEDAPDSMMSVGQAVVIKKATLGSYLMVTAAKMSHRVRRLN